MKRISILLCAICVASFDSTDVAAGQDKLDIKNRLGSTPTRTSESKPRGAQESGYPLQLLLRQSVVQDDLRLTKGQLRKVAIRIRTGARSLASITKELQGLSLRDAETKKNDIGAQRKIAAAIGRRMQSVNAQTERDLERLLTDDQVARSHQINQQLFGLQTMLAATTHKKLGLTADQRLEFAKLQQAYRDKAGAAAKRVNHIDRSVRAARRTVYLLAIDQAERDTLVRMQESLTVAQRETLRDILGDEIKFDRNDLQLRISTRIPVAGPTPDSIGSRLKSKARHDSKTKSK